MATSSRLRPSAQASRQSRAPAHLPTYQPPAHPLNDPAQRALSNLPSVHKLDKLKYHLEKSVKALTDNAGHINDCYQAKARRRQKTRARRGQQGIDDEDDDTAIDEIKVEVEEVTERMEASIRNIIDHQAAVEGTEKALKEVGQNVAAGGGAVAPTQSTLGASQFKQRRRRRGTDLDEDDSDFDETTTQTEGQENAGLSGLLNRKIAEQKCRYERMSMRDRYTANNDYIGFKRTIHDALHPGDDAPPLPNASTWFPESPRTVNTTTRNAVRQAADADKDDDDIDVLSERISIKCPITLVPMKDPVTSTKCPHSFERSAILDMLNQSAIRVGGSNRRGAQDGQQAVKCPVCEVILTAPDLRTDPVLVRKIKRIQAAQHVRDNDSEDDEHAAPPRGTQRQQAEEIDDEDGDDIDAMGIRARTSLRTPRVKSEHLASSARQRSMIPNTQPPPTSTADIVDLEDAEEEDDAIVDLEDPDEEEEEEEEEDNED